MEVFTVSICFLIGSCFLQDTVAILTSKEQGILRTGLPGHPGKPGAKGMRGVPGPRGVQKNWQSYRSRSFTLGIPGDVGPAGLAGLPGEKGNEGLSGFDGYPGPRGHKGQPGFPGPMGIKGVMGPIGSKGSKGNPGEKGDKGLPGVKGDAGLPGLPGRNASCPCYLADDELLEEEKSDVDIKTKPLNSCNFNKKGNLAGKFWVNRVNPFEVKCDMERNMTCLSERDRANKSVIDSKSITHKNNPFWVSELGFDLAEFYGVTMKQLEWLLSKSTLVTLEIIYHCKNSYIILPKDKSVGGDLRLMSWKETVIGPRPSEYSPHFYTLLPKDNGCENSGDQKTEWKQSVINISSRLKSLPITDFYVRDIRKGEQQKLYLELKELCFKF